MQAEKEALICVGHVLGAQGIKGWVRVFSNTSPRENIVNYSPWLIERDNEFDQVRVDGRLQGKHVLAKLEGVEDRSQAEDLTGLKLYIDPNQLPSLPSDEFYWSDLVGLTVESLQAETLGEVKSMIETGADDVMVVVGERERLIPFVIGEIVTEVNLDEGRMIVNWSPEYD